MNISNNIKKINEKIQICCNKLGMDPNEIKLLAVTKTQTAETIDRSLRSGISFIGENKVQEAVNKLPNLQEKYSEFHFIGHLQSNKIKKLIALRPDLIHSIDSLSTLKKLNDHLIELDLTQDILIQVNTSGEDNKSGLAPESVLAFLKNVQPFNNVKIRGLMTIGMFTDDTEKIRSCFKKLRELFDSVKLLDLKNVKMEFLSMGMTNDFEIGIEEGANIVRIGSAIFGSRV